MRSTAIPHSIIVLMTVILLTSVAFRTNLKTQGRGPDDDLKQRVSDLESRVTELENVLFATSKLEASQAQRRLERANQLLKETRKLYVRGFVTQLQVTDAELEVQQAKRELELARLESDSRCKVAEIEVVEAKRNLQFATEQLEHQRLLAQRGYASQQEIKSAEDALSAAEKKLVIANTKLEAARKLDSQSIDEGKQQTDR